MFQPSSENNMEGLLLLYQEYQEELLALMIISVITVASLTDIANEKRNFFPVFACTVHIVNIAQLTAHIHHKQTPSETQDQFIKNINPMTASVLSLMIMSGLKSFHESRLLSKQRLSKRRQENLALTTGAGSMWSPVCWLVGFEATRFGWEAY